MPDPGVRTERYRKPNRKQSTGERTRKMQRAGSPLLRKLSQLTGENVISATYAGRDARGRPRYHLTIQRGVPSSRRMHSKSGVMVRKSIALDGNKIVKPLTKGSGVPDNRPSEDELDLQREKDRALSWLNSLPDVQISPGDRRSFANQIENWKSSPERLRLWIDRVLKPNLPFGALDDGSDDVVSEGEEPWWGDVLGGLGGVGGGFGAPVYEAPDRRVVEDMAKGMMVSLLGTVADHHLKSAVDKYMADHRRNWDSETQEINPEQSLLEYIRNTQEYQTIHELRPESEDERNWISNRAALAKRGGLNTEDIEQFAIEQATAGGDEKDIEDAAAMAQFTNTGSMRGTTLEARLRQNVTNVFRGVV